MRSRRGILTRNSAANVSGHFVRLVAGLAVIPYLVTTLGEQKFAIWTIAWVITGYFGSFDLGLGEAFVKHLSYYYARDDSKFCNGAVVAGLIIYACQALVGLALWLAISKPVIALLRIPSDLQAEGFNTIAGAILILFVQNLDQDSHEDSGIQCADFVCHAFYQKHQHGNSRWYEMIAGNVAGEVNAKDVLQ